MYKVRIMMCTDSAATIILFRSVKNYLFSKERIRVTNDCSNIEVVIKVAAKNGKIIPFCFKVSNDRFVFPVMEVVDDVPFFSPYWSIIFCFIPDLSYFALSLFSFAFWAVEHCVYNFRVFFKLSNKKLRRIFNENLLFNSRIYKLL